MKLIKLIILLFSAFILSSISCAQENVLNANGENVFYYSNGTISSNGIMKNGKPEGYWFTYYDNGKLSSEGNRVNFLLDSVWRFYSEEGILKEEITYREGVKTGKNKKYNSVGKLREEIDYEDDVIHGNVIFYYEESGCKKKEVPYELNMIIGTAYEYAEEDGRIITILKYKNGFLKRTEKINRKDKKERKQGLWKFFYKNGLVKEEGTYKDNVKHGIWKTYKKSGSLDKIYKYENGELLVDAEETTTLDIRKEYYGNGVVKSVASYKNDEKDGIERKYNEEGELVNSYIYKNGKKLGEGKIDKLGKYQGIWIHYYETGEKKSEGEYENGLRVRKWIFYYENGKVAQKGNYKAGKFNGSWMWYYEDGSVRREEYFRKGYEDGELVEYDKYGEIIVKGEFSDGEKEGEWFYHMQDHTEEGSYVGGERNGIWKSYYENGKISFEGEYINGFEIGKHQFYHENGRIKIEGKYDTAVKQGDWKYYDDEGVIVFTVTYKDGIEKKYNGIKIKEEKEEIEK